MADKLWRSGSVSCTYVRHARSRYRTQASYLVVDLPHACPTNQDVNTQHLYVTGELDLISPSLNINSSNVTELSTSRRDAVCPGKPSRLYTPYIGSADIATSTPGRSYLPISEIGTRYLVCNNDVGLCRYESRVYLQAGGGGSPNISVCNKQANGAAHP